jgi:hypothetical protein
MNVKTLQTLLIIAGMLHLCITSAGIVMTKVLDWRRNLSQLEPLTRHIVWTHGAFVLLTIIAFGLISICCAPSLASGEPLARAVCAFIAGFWALRLLIGFTLFDARPHLTHWRLALAYRTLNAIFVYFVFCYAAAAINAPLAVR